MNNYKNIAIIGHTGMVGSTLFRYYTRKKYNVLGYSTREKIGFKNSTIDEINRSAEIVFVCVPTPFDFEKKKTNLEIVKKVVSQISDGKIIVIKSTVWPGTTMALQKKNPEKKLLFNPEFLSRKTAYQDFISPDRQIIGYTSKSKSEAGKILKILPKAPYQSIVKSEEAELIKYMHNVFGALRIIFSNHIYEASKKLNIDYENVLQGFVSSKYIGPGYLRYSTIFHNGKRGYGGPCFPKDINSYIEFCNKLGIPNELIDATKKANVRILKDQGLSEKAAEKL